MFCREEIPLPKFSLFSALEIQGETTHVIGLIFYFEKAAEQLELEPGWCYQLSDGSAFVSVVSEHELLGLGCMPTNQAKEIAIAA